MIDESGNFLDDSVKKYVVEFIKDDAWKKVIDESYSKCIVEALKYAEAYQEATKISKDICDFKYDAVADCIDIASFSVS